MIKQYRKTPPLNTQEKVKIFPQKQIKLIATSLLFGGCIMVMSVITPIFSYELFLAPELRDTSFLSPVSIQSQEKYSQTANAISNENETSSNKFIHPQNWFPGFEYQNSLKSKITHYTISIPKLKISDAVVEIGGEDLSKSLIQYPQTALPGHLGATIIFGHSILPQFFNPKNYMSIFSLIPTLDLGDDIIVKYDGITFTYRVIDKVEVKPTNLSVLDQPYDNEYMRLITCTPPGTYLRRGVITAALID